MSNPIYLDNNATTPIDERVLDVMMPYLHGRYGNAGSLHQFGREARDAIEQAREQVAMLVNAHPSEVVFTSGGTEANNLALKGVVFATGVQRLAYSSVEHSSVRNVAKALKKHHVDVVEISVTRDGSIDDNRYEHLLGEFSPQFVSIMSVNNETGVIFNINKCASAARARNAIFHTDAVQSAGKVKIDFRRDGPHLLSISSHKIYGPKGAGALIIDKSIEVDPLFHGGGQERDTRSGTEDVVAIVGFGKAAELALLEIDQRNKKNLFLRNLLETRLKTAVPGIEVFSESIPRVANTVFVGVKNVDAQTLLLRLDQIGFAVGTGAACSSKSGKPSTVLVAMGIESSLAHGAIRISLSHHNSETEIIDFCDAFCRQVNELCAMPRGI